MTIEQLYAAGYDTWLRSGIQNIRVDWVMETYLVCWHQGHITEYSSGELINLK